MKEKVWSLSGIFIKISGCFNLTVHYHIQLFLGKAIEYVNNTSLNSFLDELYLYHHILDTQQRELNDLLTCRELTS